MDKKAYASQIFIALLFIAIGAGLLFHSLSPRAGLLPITGMTTTVGGGGNLSRLTIFDQNDTEGGARLVYLITNATFFANYTNTTSNLSINPANCTINFSDMSGVMSYNSTSTLFEYNRSFSASGVVSYNVSCSAARFTTMNATSENITVSQYLNTNSCDIVDGVSTSPNTIVNVTGNINVLSAIPNGVCFWANAVNYTVECNGFTVDDNGAGEVGLYATSNNTHFRNCNLQEFGNCFELLGEINASITNVNSTYCDSYGVYIHGGSENITLNNIFMNRSGTSQGVITILDSNHTSFLYSTILNAETTGIAGVYLSAASYFNMTGSLVENLSNYGVEFLVNSRNGSIQDSVIKNSTLSNIFIHSSDGFSIRNSTVVRSKTENGIYTPSGSGLKNFLVYSNNISFNKLDGVQIQTNYVPANITNNYFDSNNRSAIDIVNSQAVIMNNTMVDNGFYGASALGAIIIDQGATNYTVSGNRISGSSVGISFGSSTTNSVIMDNVINNITFQGIYLATSNSNYINISNNTVSNASVGIFIRQTGNVSALGNTLLNNNISMNSTSPILLSIQRANESVNFTGFTGLIRNINGVFINNSIIAINSSGESSINRSANLSISFAGRCPVTLYYLPGFNTSASTVVSTGQVCNSGTSPACTAITCSGNTVFFNVQQFSSYGVGSPPSILSVNVISILDTQATIDWITDLASNSSVQYGTSLSLGSYQSDSSSVTSHAVVLSGLNADTLYYFNVTSCDAANQCQTNSTFNFTTASTPPPPSGGGNPVSGCTDQCSLGQTMCRPKVGGPPTNPYDLLLTCVLDSSTGCTKYSGSLCGPGESCATGQCVAPPTTPTCTDTCTPGSVQCAPGTPGQPRTRPYDILVQCIDSDGDGCYENVPSACKLGESCSTGQCLVPQQPTTQVPATFPLAPLDTSIKLGSLPESLISCLLIANREVTPDSIKTVVDSPIYSQVKEGYQTLVPAFTVTCANNAFDASFTIPDTYTDVQALRCKGGQQCAPVKVTVTETLDCGSEIFKDISRKTDYLEPEFFPIAVTKVQTASGQSSLETGKNRIMFLRSIKGTLSLEPAKTKVKEAENTGIKIIGTPLVLTFSETNTAATTELTLPYMLQDNIDEYSIAIYVKNNSDWHYLGGTVNTTAKTVTAHVDDITQYAQNNSVTLAVMGVTCLSCLNTELIKVYAGHSRDAVILVHGFENSPARYQDIINDIRLTNQPWQAWTFGYPSSKSIDDAASEFADLLQAHESEFDHIYVAAHSLGGIIAQQMLRYAYEQNQKVPHTYTFLDKVKKLIIIASPNQGAIDKGVYEDLYGILLNSKIVQGLFNLNSRVLQDIINGRNVERVPGINYYVIAGTQPYPFTQFVGTSNDGIITTESAQTIGTEPVINKCENYWEIGVTHTDLLNNIQSRKIIERIVAKEIADASSPGKAVLGYDTYYKLHVDDCSPDDQYILIGKPIKKEEAPQPALCGCGNGFCGIDENEVNCPSDCAVIKEKPSILSLLRFTLIRNLLVSLLLLLLLILLLTRRHKEKPFLPARTFSLGDAEKKKKLNDLIIQTRINLRLNDLDKAAILYSHFSEELSTASMKLKDEFRDISAILKKEVKKKIM